MHDPDSFDMSDETPALPQLVPPRPRAVGSPLSAGTSRPASNSPASVSTASSALSGRIKRLTAPPSNRVAGNGRSSNGGQPTGVQRAVSAFRSALPLVQRLLPLLDGNIASTIGNFLAPRPHPQAPPAEKVDLGPIEDGLADLRTEHQRLRNQVNEQNASLKRVQDHLEMVREATDRNTLEQQELLEALKSFGTKVKIVAIIGLLLIAAGAAMTVVLYMHIRRVLP